jgi:hypothetical protein
MGKYYLQACILVCEPLQRLPYPEFWPPEPDPYKNIEFYEPMDVHRVINVKELDKFSVNQWEFVHELNSGAIVVKKLLDVNSIVQNSIAQNAYAKVKVDVEKQIESQIESQIQMMLKE